MNLKGLITGQHSGSILFLLIIKVFCVKSTVAFLDLIRMGCIHNEYGGVRRMLIRVDFFKKSNYYLDEN